MDPHLLREGRRWPHAAAALLLLLLGGVAVLEAGRLPRWHADGSPGPGFVPLWSGVALVGLSLATLPGALRPSMGLTAGTNHRPGGPERAVLATTAALLGYVALVGLLGYTLPTMLFMTALLRLYGGYRAWRSALLGGLITLGLVLVFQVGLAIPLPRGVVGFPR